MYIFRLQMFPNGGQTLRRARRDGQDKMNTLLVRELVWNGMGAFLGDDTSQQSFVKL